MVYSKNRFIYDHSYLTGVISVEIAKKFEWGVISLKEKMTLAALMHDLKMPEDFATIADNNELNDKVSNLVKEAHYQHGEIMGVELMEEMSISADIVSIVKSHHQILNPNLTPLAIVFIVAHEFVIRFYNYQLNPAMIKMALKDTENFFKDKDRDKDKKFKKYLDALAFIINTQPNTEDIS
jgi:hypothetical protein